MTEATGSLADALKKDLEEAANAIFSELRYALLPEEGQGDQTEDTAPEVDEEDDLTPENLLNEAVRLLQLAEDMVVEDSLRSSSYVSIADRYIYLAENV